MKLDDGFVIRTLGTTDEILDAFSQYSSYFPDSFENHNQRRNFAEKIHEHGVFFASYLDDELMGCISGYANNHETKCAHVNYLVVFREAGLLRGIIWEKLLTAFSVYAKGQGMEYCTAEVADDNTYAKEQYLRMGAEVFDRDCELSRDWIKFNIQSVLDILNNAERKNEK